MEEELNKIKRRVKRYLDKDRYDHTIGVMHTAGCLAMRYGADLDGALTAGLLHDCAKCLSSDEKIRLCKKYHLDINEAEMKNPGLLHAKLGAFLAWKKYNIEDKKILRAIAAHTTGRPAMSLLDKIIYIADFIEPGRCEAPNLTDVRALAFVDLDACLFKILEDTLTYLNTKGVTVDPMTEKTYLFYKQLHDVKVNS
ncbi:bis(5'-nucleosyl)-tetraphosphatase (symmetrical) YqeK [Roseburia hominis]